jgi:predicted transposase/invertase (TIGR01784 family)
MAQNVLDNISRNEDERFLYRERRKTRQDYEHGMAVARKEGKVEGKIELARKHLGIYATIEQIANFTELSYGDVRDYIRITSTDT